MMMFEKLNQEMVRYYDNMRPRLNNPTYVSSNVGGSLGMSMQRSKSYSSMPAKNRGLDSEDNNISKKITQMKLGNSQSPSKKTPPSSHRRSQSNLHSYGMSSLQPLKNSINSRDIYEKQAKKYNIVTIQPKEYLDTINLFPKYRLENSDENYHKKMITQSLITQNKSQFWQNNNAQNIVNKKLFVNPEK